MKSDTIVADDKKLTVLFRVEPGCLGPEGKLHVEKFCDFAQQELANTCANFVIWEIVPRHDKSLSELQYLINNISLSNDQATQYLRMFNMTRDEFGNMLQDKLAQLIDSFLEHTH